jgi:transposase
VLSSFAMTTNMSPERWSATITFAGKTRIVDVDQRTKDSYLRSKYYRLKPRMGVKRAAVAIAHKIPVAVFHILADGTVYEDLGPGSLDSVSKARTSKHRVRRVEALGFRVAIEPAAA